MTDTSQNGEETVLQLCIERLGRDRFPKTCLEVGATDGVWLSNTHRLWSQMGFKALLIESDDGNFQNLIRNTHGKGPYCIQRRVEPTGESSIDMIVARSGFLTGPEGESQEMGILSIDIDGDDYHVFKEMQLRPWIVLVEFNATIPPHLDLYGKLGTRAGCSAKALARIAADKGYHVVDIVGSNIILMRLDLLAKSELTPPDTPETTRETNDFAVGLLFKGHSLCYVIQDYEGRWSLSQAPVFGFASPTIEKLEGGDLWAPPM